MSLSHYDASTYGIMFDDPDTSGICKAIPDIAGIGVVLSFVIASLVTTLASVAAAILDISVEDDMAFGPKRLKKWLKMGLTPAQLEKRRLWRRVLGRLILGFADQQLITGFSLLALGYVTVFEGPEGGDPETGLHTGAHWTLVVYMSCLSSSTHLACVLTLRKYFGVHKSTAMIRVILIILFSLLLIPSILMSRCFGAFILPIALLANHELDKKRPAPKGLVLASWLAFQVIAYAYLFYIAVMQLLISQHKTIMQWKIWRVFRRILAIGYLSHVFRGLLGKRFHAFLGKWSRKTFWFLLFLTPGTVFVLQKFFAITSIIFTLAQKFARPRPSIDWNSCSLNTPQANDTLGFGQLLALAFLVLPLFMAYECYTEEKYEMAEEDGGGYDTVASNAPLPPLKPLRQVSGGSSYSQRNPTPSINH